MGFLLQIVVEVLENGGVGVGAFNREGMNYAVNFGFVSDMLNLKFKNGHVKKL